MSKADKVNEAYSKLEAAVEKFQEAIYKFQKVYNPETVDLNELCNSLNDTMFEIDADITENLEAA